MKRLKIAIIAHGCRAGGGLILVRQLLDAMFRQSQSERFLLIYSKGYGYEEIIPSENCLTYCYKGSHCPLGRWYFETFTLPKIVRDYQPDVIFGPGNIGIFDPSCPQTLFVHNPYLYHGPKHYPNITLKSQLRAWALKRQVRRSLPKTQLIFGQIPVVQKRFSEYWNYPSEQIKIIRFPVPSEIKPQLDCSIPESLREHEEWFHFLMLTRYLAHRNPEILIPLCNEYAPIFREKKIRFITTIGQQEKGKAIKFLDKVQKSGFQDIIVNVGKLDRQEVVQYYTHCDVLWLHTLMETLCLPFLESMTMGVPILAPDFDFSRYVCADAALYYDPWNLKSVFEKLMFMVEQKERREQLIKKGHVEIKNQNKFSVDWQEAARDILGYLRELADK